MEVNGEDPLENGATATSTALLLDVHGRLLSCPACARRSGGGSPPLLAQEPPPALLTGACCRASALQRAKACGGHVGASEVRALSSMSLPAATICSRGSGTSNGIYGLDGELATLVRGLARLQLQMRCSKTSRHLGSHLNQDNGASCRPSGTIQLCTDRRDPLEIPNKPKLSPYLDETSAYFSAHVSIACNIHSTNPRLVFALSVTSVAP